MNRSLTLPPQPAEKKVLLRPCVRVGRLRRIGSTDVVHDPDDFDWLTI